MTFYMVLIYNKAYVLDANSLLIKSLEFAISDSFLKINPCPIKCLCNVIFLTFRHQMMSNARAITNHFFKNLERILVFLQFLQAIRSLLARRYLTQFELDSRCPVLNSDFCFCCPNKFRITITDLQSS